MKKHKKTILAILLLLLTAPASLRVNAQQGETVTYQVFYDNLSAYGKWLKDPVHGYVWVPEVEKGFRPYFTNGSWKMTEFGSTWISNYEWGWAPFHYGRWIYDSLYGWIWIPGMDWGPAWVVWRTDSKFYGWTPLVPNFTVSQSIGRDFLVPADWWVFVPSDSLLNPAFQKYAKSNAQYNSTMLKTTSVVKNPAGISNYISGPRAENYAKTTDQHVSVYTLNNASAPGKAIVNQDDMTLYKPVVKKWAGGSEPVPAKFAQANHPIGKLAATGNTINPESPAPPKPIVKKKKKHK